MSALTLPNNAAVAAGVEWFTAAYPETRLASPEHPDCVRIAYAFLHFQERLANARPRGFIPLKHIIERWAGRYVSMNDVIIAAHLLGLPGEYPFALKRGLVLPPLSVIADLGETMAHRNYELTAADGESSFTRCATVDGAFHKITGADWQGYARDRQVIAQRRQASVGMTEAAA